MGLFKDIITWIGSTIRATVEKILTLIENVSDEVKIMKLRVHEGLAKGMENDWFFIGYLMFSAVVTIFAIKLGMELSAWWGAESTKLNVRNLLDKLNLTNLALRLEQMRLISQIAQIMLPEYRAIVQDIYQGISGISKIIYGHTNDMSTWMIASRNVAYSALILSGADPDSSEMLAYAATEPWVTKISKRFERYVKNPYLIMDDLREEVIKPVLQPVSEENIERLGRFEDAYLRTQENVDNIRVLNESLQEWVSILPDDIQLVVDEKIGGVMEWVEGVLDKVADPILEKVGDSIDLIYETRDEIARWQKEFAERHPGLKEEIYDYFALSSAERQDSLKLLRALLNKELALANEEYYENLDDRYGDYMDEIETLSERPIPPLEIPIIDRGTTVTIPDVKYSSDSWFVGEY